MKLTAAAALLLGTVLLCCAHQTSSEMIQSTELCPDCEADEHHRSARHNSGSGLELEGCTNPPDIEHATAQVFDYDRTRFAVYQCSCGYTRKGPIALHCHSATPYSEWEGTQPTCTVDKVDCGKPDSPSGGRQILTEGTAEGARVHYKCNRGYKLIGRSLRTCGHDGRWDGRVPTCKAQCEEPDEIPHGRVYSNEGLTVGSKIHYTCNTGYRLSGTQRRVCGRNGVWSGTAPSCRVIVPINCGVPPTIQHGRVSINSGTTQGSHILYSCNSGYKLAGPSVRLCQRNGQWQGRQPTCKVRVDCKHPGGVQNGDVDVSRGTTLGAKVYYTCDRGYKILGSGIRICGAHARWSGTKPTCQRNCSPGGGWLARLLPFSRCS